MSIEFEEVWRLLQGIKTPYFTRSNVLDLFENSLKIENGTLVEIGSAFGFSSSLLGLTAKNNGNRLFCIDPWVEKFSDKIRCVSNQGMFKTWSDSIKKSGCVESVTPLMGASSFIRKGWNDKVTIDFLFIDGMHNYRESSCSLAEEGMNQHEISEGKIKGWLVDGIYHTAKEMQNVPLPEYGVKVDFDLWSPLIKTGGYIALHDIGFDDLPAVTQVWKEDIVACKEQWQIISERGHLGIAKKVG